MTQKIIIAGGRDFNDIYLLDKTMKQFISDNHVKDYEIVCGMAKGADMLGFDWAKKNNIAVKEFPADWDRYGKSAGFKRNKQMLDYATMVIAFWDGQSKGTEHMIKITMRGGKRVQVVRYDNKSQPNVVSF